MKKTYFIFVMVLFCCLFTGCGKEESAGYFDIQSESKPFYDVSGATEDVRSKFLGMQYYQDEPVQIWAVQAGTNREKANLYLYKADGSRECIQKDLPEDFFYYNSGCCYIDRDGYFYYFSNAGEKGVVTKMDPSGTRLYRHEEEGLISIDDICQLPDGRILVSYSSGSPGVMPVLGELEPNTGIISNITDFIYEYTMRMGTGGRGLVCLDNGGIYEVNMENGQLDNIWSFVGTSYELDNNPSRKIWDFKITEDGNAELLRGAGTGAGTVETLQRVEVGTDRISIVVRGVSLPGDIKTQAAAFNQINDTYHIVVEECDPHGDWDDYRRQTSIEVGAGKGPDIFYGYALEGYAYGIAQKEGFVDLAPYLEDSGIEETDYFPCAFGRWRDGGKIYSVTVAMRYFTYGSGAYYMDAAVLGGSEEPDIETLTDALLAWPKNAIYMDYTDCQGVLDMLLEGTDSIWGMLDWEAGTCDFSGELFAKILETAKRYGYDERNNFPGLVQQEYFQLYSYMDRAMLEEEGKVIIGPLFDDGCHAKLCEGYTFSINANSARKEGAWEFIRFLLEEESQKEIYDAAQYPVSKRAFDSLIEEEQAEQPDIEMLKRMGLCELTDNRVKELKEVLEDTRFLPFRTAPVLEIISDEAQDYFDGVKSIDEVTTLINNRVQLYLDEIHS